MKKNELYNFDVEYKSNNKYLIIIAIIIFIIILTIGYGILDEKPIIQEDKKVIYNLDELLKDDESKPDISYIRTKRDTIYYVPTEEKVIISIAALTNNEKYDIDEYNSFFNKKIKVLYFIDQNGSVVYLNNCYGQGSSITSTFETCMRKDKNYIISKPDKAIIDETYFMKNKYNN